MYKHVRWAWKQPSMIPGRSWRGSLPCQPLKQPALLTPRCCLCSLQGWQLFLLIPPSKGYFWMERPVTNSKPTQLLVLIAINPHGKNEEGSKGVGIPRPHSGQEAEEGPQAKPSAYITQTSAHFVPSHHYMSVHF